MTVDGCNAYLLGETPEAGIVEQVIDGERKTTITIPDLLANPAHLLIGAGRGDPLVGAQPLPHVGNIVVGNARLYTDIDLRTYLFIDLFATQFMDRPFKHLGVEVEPNRLNVAGLLPPKEISPPPAIQDRGRRSETRPRDRRTHVSPRGGVGPMESVPARRE